MTHMHDQNQKSQARRGWKRTFRKVILGCYPGELLWFGVFIFFFYKLNYNKHEMNVAGLLSIPDQCRSLSLAGGGRGWGQSGLAHLALGPRLAP